MRMRLGGPGDVRAPPCGRRRRRTQEGLCRVSPPDQTDKRTGAGRLIWGQGEGGFVYKACNQNNEMRERLDSMSRLF
jgi:hypothetical protein